MTPEQASYYIAGIIDGEGSVRNTRDSRRVDITNTDQDIITAACEALEVLGIEHHVKPRRVTARRRPAWDINIYGRANYEKLSRLPLRSAKQQRLADLVADYTRRQPVALEQWRLLIAEGLTDREMAERLGYRRHSSVQYHRNRLRAQGLI